MMDRVRRSLRRLVDRHREEPDMQWKVSNLTRQVVIADRVEVADRGAKRMKGLLGRKGLEPGGGLWIVPCESVHTFGMRFPIDLVYIDREKRVRKVKSGVPPWRASACFSAHSVIELASGAAAASKTQSGDQLEISPAGPIE